MQFKYGARRSQKEVIARASRGEVCAGIELSCVLLKAERQMRRQRMKIKALFVSESSRRHVGPGRGIINRYRAGSRSIGDTCAARVQTNERGNSKQQTTDKDFGL